MISTVQVVNKTSKFKRTNTATLYKDKSNVYKIIERNAWLFNDIITNIVNNYKIHDKVDPKIILPTDLISDSNGFIRGYKCDLVKGKTLENLARKLSTEEKVLLLNRLTYLLEEINQFLVVGDINLANCMFDHDLNGYLLDFDLSTLIGEKASRMSLYNFVKKNTREEIRSDLNTDKLKMAIICASILYKTDFEAPFIISLPYNSWNKFYQFTENSLLKDYFKSAFKSINHDGTINDYLYLPNDSSFVKLVDEDYQKVRRNM